MTAKDWLEKAKQEKFAIGAFNVGNLETFKAIAQAASQKKSPVIIESSPGETDWLGVNNIYDLAANYSQQYQIPIFVNLDHAKTIDECVAGITAGYNLIHFDGSGLPYQQNLDNTQKIVELAHAKDLTVEGEIDHIGGSSTVHASSAIKEAIKQKMTDPGQAANFVKATGVDIFAVFIGNVHGVYLGEGKKLDFARLAQIAQITDCFLSLHGGSGISDEQIRQAIELGIVKININSEIRQAFKDTLDQVIHKDPQEYAMYKLEQPVINEIVKVVEYKIDIFGSANKL